MVSVPKLTLGGLASARTGAQDVEAKWDGAPIRRFGGTELAEPGSFDVEALPMIGLLKCVQSSSHPMRPGVLPPHLFGQFIFLKSSVSSSSISVRIINALCRVEGWSEVSYSTGQHLPLHPTKPRANMGV